MANVNVTSKFLNMARGFFPSGFAWRRVFESDSNLSKTAELIASEAQRINSNTARLERQFIHNREFSDLLLEWEESLGLPYYCEKDLDLSHYERRLRVVQKFTREGSLTKTFYESLIQLFEYDLSDISIRNWKASTCDDFRCDDYLRGASSEFTIEIIISNTMGVVNDDLLCFLSFFTPAHMKINTVFN